MDKQTALERARKRWRDFRAWDFIPPGGGVRPAIRNEVLRVVEDVIEFYEQALKDEKAKFEDQRNHFNRDLADSGRAEYARGCRDEKTKALKVMRDVEALLPLCYCYQTEDCARCKGNAIIKAYREDSNGQSKAG